MNISNKSLVIALLFSAAINLIILGAVGGMMAASLRHNPAAPPIPITKIQSSYNFRFNPKVFIRALPEPERRKAIKAMRMAAGKHRQIYKGIGQTHRELGALLTAENLDDEKIAKTFARLRVQEAEAQELGQTIILDILRNLDPQTRKRVIRAASRKPERRKRVNPAKQRQKQRQNRNQQ